MERAGGVSAASLLERLAGRIAAALLPGPARTDVDAGLPQATGHSGVLRLPNNANFEDWAGQDESTDAPEESNGGSR